MSKPERTGELVQPETAEGWTVYEPETDSLHVLNATAKAIWDLCDGETAASEMADAVSELTGLNLGQAARDVTRTLRILRELNLVRF